MPGLNYDQMVHAITKGYSVYINGTPVTRVEDLPSRATIAQRSPEQAADALKVLQAQQDETNRQIAELRAAQGQAAASNVAPTREEILAKLAGTQRQETLLAPAASTAPATAQAHSNAGDEGADDLEAFMQQQGAGDEGDGDEGDGDGEAGEGEGDEGTEGAAGSSPARTRPPRRHGGGAHS